jgi:RNA polymerase primary sigma factor
MKTKELPKAKKARFEIPAPAKVASVPEPAVPHQSADAFTLYIREMGETPLLTVAEEVVLAKRIKKGDKAAREQMIKANLRLVVKIARDYESYGLPLLDLINEGNIGLMKAVDRFDPKKGAKLSTYASWWIKQSIRRAISDQSKTIRLPVHVGDKLLHIRRAETRFQEEFGRLPTDEELGGELGLAPRRIAQYRQASIRPSSLDAPIGDDSNTIAEIVADENAGTPLQALSEKTDTALIHEVLPTLDAREQEILRQRFGLDGDEEKTLEEVGAKFGVTRERIRQIQEIALAKLRRKIEQLELSVAE